MKTTLSIILICLAGCNFYQKEQPDPNSDCQIVYWDEDTENEIGVCTPLWVENQCDLWLWVKDSINLSSLLNTFEVSLRTTIYQKSTITIEVLLAEEQEAFHFEILKVIREVVDSADKRNFEIHLDTTNLLRAIHSIETIE